MALILITLISNMIKIHLFVVTFVVIRLNVMPGAMYDNVLHGQLGILLRHNVHFLFLS